MTDPLTFGRRLAASPTAQARLELEAAEGRRAEFAELDALIERLIGKALRGERALQFVGRWDSEVVELADVTETELGMITGHLDVPVMEARGAWSLPDREPLDAGAINQFWWTRQEPRFIGALLGTERRKFQLRGNPPATFAWATVAPAFELLEVPLVLRVMKVGQVEVAAQEKQWAQLDALLSFAELDVEEVLAPFRPRSGWSRLSADERANARTRLADRWSELADPEVAARLRVWLLDGLLQRFYAKSKKVTATSRQVLTRASWRPLVGLFGGDWLAFLDYLGEEPASGEQIITTLPEPRLYVGATDRGASAAAAAGVEAAEVELMLSSFFGGQDASSPVEARVSVLKKAWAEVDSLHAQQEPGGQAMWGLLDERRDVSDDRFEGYQFGLHQALLSQELNDEVARLWGTEATSRNPDRLVTRTMPHAGMLDAFGPALEFWHLVGLAAFGNTEGLTYFDHALIDLNQKYSYLLEPMMELGHPVDRSFFLELNDAARNLGDAYDEGELTSASREVAPGLSVEISITGPRRRVRREGFRELNEVITRHRRAWAVEHLDAYLGARWQSDLRTAADAYNRHLSGKGKEATARQTISASKDAMDRWFGGDVRLMLAAIGQTAPKGDAHYRRIMPAEPYGFRRAVQRNLGLIEEPKVTDSKDREALIRGRQARSYNEYRGHAATVAYAYVQSYEALDALPEMKQVKGGSSAATWLTQDTFAEGWHKPTPEELESAWAQLADAINTALADPDLQVRRYRPELTKSSGIEDLPDTE